MNLPDALALMKRIDSDIIAWNKHYEISDDFLVTRDGEDFSVMYIDDYGMDGGKAVHEIESPAEWAALVAQWRDEAKRRAAYQVIVNARPSNRPRRRIVRSTGDMSAR